MNICGHRRMVKPSPSQGEDSRFKSACPYHFGGVGERSKPSALQADDRRFKSDRLYHRARSSARTEHLATNQRVGRSNRSGRTILTEIA